MTTKKQVKTAPSKKKKKTNKDFYTIGVGTSAGGLEALKTFFDNIPANFDHAIVIVQHLSPNFKSLMAELLSRNTELPIQEVKEGTTIKPGHVYLIPAKKNMAIKNGILHLTNKPKRHELNLPIDIFFKSLAQDKGSRAIAIVLSGTGSDGTRGIRAIKEAGGMLMVQSPQDAQFDGMPNSAIATGLIDYVLPSANISVELVNFINHPKSDIEAQEEKQFFLDKDFLQLLEVVRKKTDIDFTRYKMPTLSRRVMRRMSVKKLTSISDYLNYLQSNEEEVETLYREFLIGVTKFFRNNEAFDYIEKEIIPSIFSDTNNKEPIKVWSVGCSTGEEAYSLAILFKEYMDKKGIDRTIKIFATDLDEYAIQTANKGIFSESIVADVSLERLKKFFIKKDHVYHISPIIRKMIIFSNHNATQDPPLTKMDLVICRNLLIYLQSSLQQKLLAALHYAAKPNRYLFIGPSESIGMLSTSFKMLSRKWKIYKNINPTRTINFSDYNSSAPLSSALRLSMRQQHKPHLEHHLSDFLAESLLGEYNAASAYIDENYELISADGNFKRYIQLPSNKFRSLNVMKMLPKSLSMTLASAIRKADKLEGRVSHNGIRIKNNDAVDIVNFSVHPVKSTFGSHQKLYLILFLKEFKHTLNESDALTKAAKAGLDGQDHEKNILLEQELQDTRAHLQNTLEEVETSNEELQATNEELLASNEELQSTNEELQSVNEELHTVNSEHQNKIEELVQVNDDLENLVNSTDIGTIFLDNKLIIRKFTPAIKTFFNIIENDIGRPIAHFSSTFGEKKSKVLIEDAIEVMRSRTPIEREIKINNGHWYLKRIHPFINSLNEVKGVSVSFIDISYLKKLKDELQQKNHFLEKVTNLVPGTIYIYNQQTQSNEYANKELTNMLGYSVEEVQGMGENVMPNIVHPNDLPLIPTHFEKIRTSKEGTIHDLEYRVKHKDGSYRWFLSYDTIFENNAKTGTVKHIGVTTDVTKIKQAEDQVKDLNSMYNTIIEGSMAGYWDWHIQKNYEYMSPTFKSMFGYQDEEVPNTPDWWQQHIHPDDLPRVLKTFDAHVKSKGKVPYDNEVRYYHKNGSIVWVYCRGKVIEWSDKGEPLRMVGSHVNITNMKEVQKNLESSNNDLEQFSYIATHDIKTPITNIDNYLNLLKTDEDIQKSNSKKAIEWIDKSVIQAKQTIEDLVKVTKERKETDLKIENIDLNELLQKTKDGLNAEIELSKANIKANFKKYPTIKYNKLKADSLMHNLMSNAIKYRSSERPLKIELGTKEDEHFVCLSVKDNGIGIDLERDKEKVFGLFKRAHAKIAGSGIGLHMTKQSLENMGGKIEVESEVDKGTTFKVYFKKNVKN